VSDKDQINEELDDKNVSEDFDESKSAEEVDERSEQVEVDDEPQQPANEAVDYEDKYLRAQADIQNIQQRFAKEQTNWRMYDGSRLAESLLPAVDNLERALAVGADGESAKQIKTGVEMVYKAIKNAFKDNNITEFGEVGDEFNPELHQAIQIVPIVDEKTQKPDTIAQVLQKGYKISDRTLRTAMVAVYQD
jgi:molecular chaperone GrpE